jgi:murein DD-endopeptidase MepM/ murein hydrolase activator NlpD
VRGPARLADLRLARDSEAIKSFVPPQTTLSALLRAHELGVAEITAVVEAVGPAFDVRRLRSGQPYRLDRYFDGRVREFEYEIDLERRLLVERSDVPGAAPFEVAIVPIPRTMAQVVVDGAITRESPSLVQAIDAAGERIELSLALADVFSGEVDFSSDLQPGDSFRLVVQRATRDDGAFAGYGPVLAAEYATADRTLRAIRFTPPSGKPGYYDAEGRSLTRFFLKSPLKFEPRVTSSFSTARRHPILNYTRAHNGVDYSAPPGAPVAAVASGVVTFAGWTSGGGRTVRIKHGGGYESEYLHMSAIAAGVRAGARIGQGELVGRVGSTGLATGPHLHYGLRKNGSYVNPVREHQRMPPGDPLAAEDRASFNEARSRALSSLQRD